MGRIKQYISSCLLLFFIGKWNRKCDLNRSIFLTKKSIDLNHDWNQWFKSHWFKSANPAQKSELSASQSLSFKCQSLRQWFSNQQRPSSTVIGKMPSTCAWPPVKYIVIGWLHFLTWLSLSHFAERKFGLSTYLSTYLSQKVGLSRYLGRYLDRSEVTWLKPSRLDLSQVKK